MKLYPNCKVNLGLHVIRKRPDGYHDLETIFVPVPFLTDILEIEPAKEFVFRCEGLSDCAVEDNIVVRTYNSMKELYNIPPVSITLTKRIPTGAGLGGGSSDAAFAARALNEIFALGLTDEQLICLLSPIGADCPFFVLNRPCLAMGIGDRLESVELSLEGLGMAIVKPPVSVPTRLAYSKVVPRENSGSLSQTFDLRNLPSTPVARWREVLVNDFEASVFPEKPQIAAVKQSLYDAGAVYAAMSGSGSAVLALFDQQKMPSTSQLKGMFGSQMSAVSSQL